jgi:predicted DNA-binding transcriptional regulator AlpA
LETATREFITLALQRDATIPENRRAAILAGLTNSEAAASNAARPPQLITTKSAMKILGVGRTTFWKLVRQSAQSDQPQLKPVYLLQGGHPRWPAEAVERFARVR